MKTFKQFITEATSNHSTIEDIVNEYNAEIHKLTLKAEKLRKMGQGKSAMEVENQIEKLGKELQQVIKNESYKIGAQPVLTLKKADGKYTEVFDDGDTITFNRDGSKYGSHKFKNPEEAKRVLKTSGYSDDVKESKQLKEFDLRDPDPTGELEAAARRRVWELQHRRKWTDVYTHFDKAPLKDLEKIKNKRDALKFLVSKGEDPNDPAVKKAVEKMFE